MSNGTGGPGGGDAGSGDGIRDADGGPGPDADRVREALREVIDPEVGLDVVAMGLIYRIEVEGGSVRIRHTLTTPGCPMEGVLKRGIAEAARSVPGVDEVQTEVVWEPPWHPAMIADDAWD